MAEQLQYWNEGIVFIGIMLVVVGVPCAAVAFLGTRLIDHIGQHPSRSARMQLTVCVQLLVIEIVSFSMLALFLHVFS